MSGPVICRRIDELRGLRDAWRGAGTSIGLVPTMGALHEGHLSLVRAAKAANDRVIASIFVNPTQFGPNEDLDAYPATWEADIDALTAEGVDAVFAPTRDEVYPQGFATGVRVAGLTEVLCGESRPGHFDGVTQVVAKLLNIAQADRAYFGEKDWQQLAVIRRMATDLNFRTEICGVPIVRAEDGLALSSRNAYLDEAQRAVAPKLNEILLKAAARITGGEGATGACAYAAVALEAEGFDRTDYVECRDAVTLQEVEKPEPGQARLFGAALLGRARLIDNVAVG